MFIYNDDMERLMQAKKREILFEIEQTKDRILSELSGVDKCTLGQLREILNNYNLVEFMITTKMNAIEERIITFTGAYGDNLSEMKESLLEEIQELEKTFNSVNAIANEALTIAKGKNRSRVFATTEEMNAFLSDKNNVGQLQVGDNLYIVALDVPDWWVSEALTKPNSKGMYYNIAQLETQKVDLSNIGKYYIATISEDVITQSGKAISVASLTLPKGTYILTACVRFASNSNGYRYANISSTSGSTAQYVNSTPTGSNAPTVLNLAMCIDVKNETSTLHLNAFQSSGEDLTCSSSGTQFRAIRLS